MSDHKTKQRRNLKVVGTALRGAVVHVTGTALRGAVVHVTGTALRGAVVHVTGLFQVQMVLGAGCF